MSRYFSARDKYKPDKIGTLLIAESPPASGGYFYFETATGRGGLFVETMRALQLIPEGRGLPRGSDKRPLLKAFRDGGFFVLDVSYEPVNDKKTSERKLAIKRELPRLVSDVKKLDPSGIIIVKFSLYEPVRKALEKAGFGGRILNKEALPFPSHGHQKTYRKKLGSMVNDERKREHSIEQKKKSCLVACSVLKKEIAQLVKQGDLDAECVYVSKYIMWIMIR